MTTLTSLLAAQMTGYFTYDNNFDKEQLKKINYITASNGTFRVEKTPIGLFKVKISETKKPIPGLKHMEEGVELFIPKIPFRFLQQALSFYTDVYDQDKTEASLLFFWNGDNKPIARKYSDGQDVKGLFVEGQLVIYVPRQKNSGTLSEFHIDPMVDWLRNNLSILCESHSHHVMQAFFSGTDDANENATQFYGVWGKIKDKQPQFAFRYCSGDAKVECCPSVLFEWPMVKERTTLEITADIEGFQPETYVEETEKVYMGPFPKIEYPSDWLGQHSKSVSFTTKKTYGSTWKSQNKKQKGKKNEYAGGASLWDFDKWEEDYYRQYNWKDETQYDSFNPATKENDSYDYADDMVGMDFARIKKMMDPNEDNPTIRTIAQREIDDITINYRELGLDRIVEASIDACK